MTALRFAALLALTLTLNLLTGCPRPVPRPAPPPSTDPGMPPCPATEATSAEVCDGLFTDEGLACVRCPGATGCLDVPTQVYCTEGPCLDDRKCRLEQAPSPDGGVAGLGRSHR